MNSFTYLKVSNPDIGNPEVASPDISAGVPATPTAIKKALAARKAAVGKIAKRIDPTNAMMLNRVGQEREAASGLPTGKRMHKPSVIIKPTHQSASGAYYLRVYGYGSAQPS